MTVIDFQSYKKSKNSLLARVMNENKEVIQGIAAYSLQQSLQALGFTTAKVFHHNHNYIVVLDLGFWKFHWLMLNSLLQNHKMEEGLTKCIGVNDPDVKSLKILRRNPSLAAAKKLMKEWSSK